MENGFQAISTETLVRWLGHDIDAQLKQDIEQELESWNRNPSRKIAASGGSRAAPSGN